MITEQCAICDATVSFDDTVHVLLNTKSAVGVLDYYVCTDCYDADLAPLFPDHPSEDAADGEATGAPDDDGDAAGDADDATDGDGSEGDDGDADLAPVEE